MNLEEYQVLFLLGTLGLALVASSPLIAIAVPFQSDYERFSEFWLLGPDHLAEDFPSSVVADEMYNVFVGLGNHMGFSEYYTVYVKIRNVTQSLHDLDSSQPSPSSPLYEFRFSVADEEVWESLVTFGFPNVTINDDIMTVNKVIINGIVFPVDVSTSWDAENNGFYFQMFFELWRYDVTLKSFQFADQSVGFWPKMTDS